MGLPIGWKDLVIAGTQARVGASAPAFSAFAGGIYRLKFVNAATDEVHAEWHIGHDYAPGTQVYMHVHWTPSTTNTGVCRWGFEWVYAARDGSFTGTTTYVEQAGGGSVTGHQVAESVGITIAGLETDGLIVVRLFRDGAHGNDTFTGDAFLHTFDLHYQASHIATVGKDTVGAWVPT